jgi:glycosyltransferase involved in cell wall biosynthesis
MEGRAVFRDSEGPHFGFLGRIVEEKGVEYLVSAFLRLEDPDARLLIAGDGSGVAGRNTLDLVRQTVGSDHRVKILGFLSDSDVDNFYSSIDVFCLPSVNSFEAFGIVQVNALMAGLPVIASDLPGVRIPARRTGHGVIVSPRDVDDLERALRESAVLKRDATVSAIASATYGLQAASKQWLALLSSLGLVPSDASAGSASSKW